ncbi:MAG TPA: putative ABC transporter permease, partial [Candidatus Saccharibacteria bacterium]|nr:putative ABC transporter permease [Candidatus Saccharibacteria bacterium]
MLIAQLMIYFTVYSCIGWLWEVLYVRVTEHRWNNQGFLAGPYLPIYGFGALMAIVFIAPLPIDTFWKFILCGVLATIAEYITHFLLEKLFGMRLWDYSKFPLNIRGRVCLFASLAFAAMALFVINIVHPIFELIIGYLPAPLVIGSAGVFAVGLVSDFMNTLHAATLYRRGKLHSELRRMRRRTMERLARAFPILK